MEINAMATRGKKHLGWFRTFLAGRRGSQSLGAFRAFRASRSPLTIVALALIAVACGDGDDPPRKKAGDVSAPTHPSYSIKGYLVTNGERLRVDFAPAGTVDKSSSKGTEDPGEKKALAAPTSKTQALGNCRTGTGGCTSLDIGVEANEKFQTFDGELLLLAIANSCLAETTFGFSYSNGLIDPRTQLESQIKDAVLDPTDPAKSAALPRVWDKRPDRASWFVFLEPQAAQVGCDEILARQEVLLCTASRLGEIADAVGTTDIPASSKVPSAADPSTGTHWEFPVQDNKDKFILRDLALSTLSHVALLETILPPASLAQRTFFNEGAPRLTCSDVYVKATSINAISLELLNYATYSTYGWLENHHRISGDTRPVTVQRMRELISMRASYKTNVFRASGRLVRDLLDKSVQADIAGAERRRADAGDPVRGLELMWGADVTDPDAHFNSMRHALGLLFGDLDAARSFRPSQFCPSGVHGEYKVIESLGPGFSSRWRDRPPQTAGQSLALSLVTKSGVLLPDVEMSDKDVRSAVEEELVRNAATERAVALDTFKTSAGGLALSEAFARLKTEDLRFALDRNRDAYSQLADVAPPITSIPTSGPGGLVFATAVPQSTVAGLNGVVVKDGMPRQYLHGDMMATAGRAQVASQCGLFFGAGDAPIEGTRIDRLGAFQNAFTLGHVFQHRLAHLSNVFDLVNGVKGSEEVVKNARSGAAELRTWAGPGLVISRPTDLGVTIAVVGLSPGDIGAANIEDMPNRLALVRGEPWKANCVAGLRQCATPVEETAFEAEAHAIPDCTDFLQQTTVAGSSMPECDFAGYFGSYLRLDADVGNADQVYSLVQRPQGDVPGRVLATIVGGRDLVAPVGLMDRIEVISDYQRELLNQIFGTGNPSRRGSTCGDVTSTAIPDNYCIAGMQRDMFVPLANELTSDGGVQEDSWKHYLGLAESAAAHADELGRQLIEAGKERELRREGAQEALGGICGTFVNVNDVKIEDGEVAGDERDEPLNSCIHPVSVDLVFLTEDPWKDHPAASKNADDAIRAKYCGGNVKPHFCSKKQPVAPAVGQAPVGEWITHHGLGLKSYVPQSEPAKCDAILKLAGKVAGEGAAPTASELQAIASEPWVTEGGLLAGFGGIKLTVRPRTDEAGEIVWEGSRYDKVVLAPKSRWDGDPTGFVKDGPGAYPACLETAAKVCTGLAEQFRQIFGPADTAVNHGVIRRRVEAALFNLGALQRHIPAETFSIPLPVYNANADLNPRNSQQSAQAPAIYSNANLTLDGDGTYRLIIGSIPPHSEGNSNALGAVTPPDSTYWTARSKEDTDLTTTPRWRRDLYAQAEAQPVGTYSLVQAVSPLIHFNKQIQGTTGEISRSDNIDQWLREFATAAAGPCVAWGSAPPIMTLMHTLSDGVPANLWYEGTNADRALPAEQRNICPNQVYPVFYENTVNRELHLRTNAWHKMGGREAFVKIIEDMENPSNAMHKEKAVFFTPFGRCGREANPSLIKENCIKYEGFAEALDDLSEIEARQFVPFPGTCTLGGLGPNPCHPDRPFLDGQGDFRSAVENRLQPINCSPSDRAELFVNRYPDTTCQLSQAVVQGLALACVLGNEPVGLSLGAGPPAINSAGDLPSYQAWLSALEVDLSVALNAGYFINFPEAVVKRYSGEENFTSPLGEGAQGKSLLDLANQVEGMHSAWSSMTGAVRELGSAVRTLQLELASVHADQAQKKLLQQQEQLKLSQQIVVNAIEAVSSLSGNFIPGNKDFAAGGGKFAVATTNLAFAMVELDILAKKEAALIAAGQATEDRAVDSFGVQVARTFDNLDQAVTGIRTASNEILRALNEVASNKRAASWEVAKAAGSDFVKIDGEEVSLHVNTVLNRQYNILRLRYERALSAAKRSAYLARLSMEQRIGVRLADVRAPLGPIEPPATWVENLCSVQGIDYEKLRLAESANPTFDDRDSSTIQTFANQYIGDYVAQLREFIEFYNIEYPFRQADDQAVLSLREHLLSPDTQCTIQSRNELYHSDALHTHGQSGDDFQVRLGWSIPGCVEDGCMHVQDGQLLRNVAAGETLPSLPVEPPGGIGGVSWLRVTADAPYVDPGQVPGQAGGSPLPASPEPFGTVYQTVPLRAGHYYVLSWWDMARSMDGGPLPLASDPQAYFVGIYDERWQLVAVESPVAHAKQVQTINAHERGLEWSRRRELTLTAFEDGDYHVVFAPSELGVRPASLAIANVQLEEPDKQIASSSSYTRTEGSRTIVNTACKAVSKEQLRQAFVRRCEGGRGDAQGRAETCYFELDRDIVIDAEQHEFGFGGLTGQVGRDNYNIRHVDLGMNIVGTGLLDCSSENSDACYGSAFVEYDLEHIAFNAPIVDYSGETHCFNFAKGAIRSGKALAAERYLTLPLGSADAALLAQPAFRKTELFGRPLSGLYKLRIRDNPALVWENLEDIQIIVGHRYWSRVARP